MEFKHAPSTSFSISWSAIRSRTLYEPSWLSKLYRDNEYEAQYNKPVMLLPENVRERLWNFARELFGGERVLPGMAGQAAQVFERYCIAVARECYDMSKDEWNDKVRQIICDRLLIGAVCLRLVCKIDSQCSVSSRNILVALEQHGKSYTMDDINYTERRVFSSIGFQIPMWTNVQKVQMLTAELGYVEDTINSAGVVMNLIELKLPLLCKRIRKQSRNPFSPASAYYGMESSGNPRNGEIYIPTLHLLAGVVLATVRYLDVQGPDFAPTLAHWIRVTVDYVHWFSDFIYGFVNECVSSVNKKLRRNDYDSDSSDQEYMAPSPKRQRLI